VEEYAMKEDDGSPVGVLPETKRAFITLALSPWFAKAIVLLEMSCGCSMELKMELATAAVDSRPNHQSGQC
jgi:hypothetical protein